MLPTDERDAPAMMSGGGLVDPATAQGQVDEEADTEGSVAAMVNAGRGDGLRATGEGTGGARHLAHITRRRGSYPQPAPTRS